MIQNTRPELRRVSFRGQEYLFDYPTYAIHNSLQLGSEACDAAR